ncbi:MAG: phage terminase large subunit family protein [Synergistaceae bacterium]|nr:phage terminase large subunit family protein [Synergistaceae bacterium]
MSRIEKAYEASTKERWCVPCPTCGEFQPYDWNRVVYKNVVEPLMKCAHCGALNNEAAWKSGQSGGVWVAERSGERTRGFHLNAFASPWVTWAYIIQQDCFIIDAILI